jgi:hypothetical protein
MRRNQSLRSLAYRGRLVQAPEQAEYPRLPTQNTMERAGADELRTQRGIGGQTLVGRIADLNPLGQAARI